MGKIGWGMSRKQSAVYSVILLAAAMSVAVGAGSPVGQAAVPVQDGAVKPVAAGVSALVSQIVFSTPQTLDELEVQLVGTRVLQLRYTGDVTGMLQPGPGINAHEAIAQLREDTTREYQAPPLVFMVIVDGIIPADAVVGALVTIVASGSPDINRLPLGLLTEAARATRDRQVRLAAHGVPIPNPHLDQVVVSDTPRVLAKEKSWSPVQGEMQAWELPNGDRVKFRHTMIWGSQTDIDAFGDDFGYEHNMSLYNYGRTNSTRPLCNPSSQDDFWAAWKSVSWGANTGGEAAPYMDWDDFTDSCQKFDFTIGIGYPTKLQPQRTYELWVEAQRGTQSSSPYELVGQKVSNDCNDQGRAPDSACMGLDYQREGSGTEQYVNKNRGWTVPACAIWHPSGNPVKVDNREFNCPPGLELSPRRATANG